MKFTFRGKTSKRAELLAQRIEQGADALAAYAEGLSDVQWRTAVPPGGRPAGVIVHHVASVYPIEVHLATDAAAGKPITGVTWGGIAEMNAKHAHEHQSFTDEQLDSAAPVSLNAGATLTAQFLLEDHAVRHSWHHLAKIKAVFQVSQAA